MTTMVSVRWTTCTLALASRVHEGFDALRIDGFVKPFPSNVN